MEIAQNTPKAARKSTAGRKTATPPEIYAEGYETRVVYPAVNVPTPLLVTITKKDIDDYNAALDKMMPQPARDVRAAVVNFRSAEFAVQPPAQPSFR